MLDWKGAIKHDDIGPWNIIYSYCSKIFNSMEICNNPTIEVIKRNLETYNVYDDLTDNTIDLSELECALHNMGKGSSFDGLASKGLLYLPQNLKECILLLCQKIFGRVYPSQWQKLLLSPIPKKGHVINDPNLRGIAVGPLLSRVYDVIINNRFCTWYTPNPNQAGFRKGQYSYSLFLSMNMAKYLNTSIYIYIYMKNLCLTKKCHMCQT